jgi:diguanylate cyclase (GGDEF)-like protein
MCDLDGFKTVNDDHGHLEGDRVLREVAAAMANALRGEDRIFRVGGDEFAALLVKADLMQAEGIGERLSQAADPLLRRYGASISVGVAVPRPGEAVSAVLARVDADLYRIKRGSRR